MGTIARALTGRLRLPSEAELLDAHPYPTNSETNASDLQDLATTYELQDRSLSGGSGNSCR